MTGWWYVCFVYEPVIAHKLKEKWAMRKLRRQNRERKRKQVSKFRICPISRIPEFSSFFSSPSLSQSPKIPISFSPFLRKKKKENLGMNSSVATRELNSNYRLWLRSHYEMANPISRPPELYGLFIPWRLQQRKKVEKRPWKWNFISLCQLGNCNPRLRK